MTIVCLILSRFYPRMYASVEVQVPTMKKTDVPTHMQIVRTSHILAGVLARHPEFKDVAGADTLSWMHARIDVRHVEKDILEIRMSGRPAERERLQELVNAIAEEYVDLLVELDGSAGNLAAWQKSYDELKASAVPVVDTDLPIEDPRRITAEREKVRRDELLQAVEQRLGELEKQQEQSPGPPKVLRHSTGFDW